MKLTYDRAELADAVIQMQRALDALALHCSDVPDDTWERLQDAWTELTIVTSKRLEAAS